MKSVIISGFTYQHLQDLPQKLISKFESYDKIFYLAGPEDEYLSSPKVYVYNVFDIALLHYPNYFSIDVFQPLDESVVKEFAECEQICLKMFDRSEFWFDLSYEKRKMTYLYHLRYWYSIIKKYNVDLMICSNVSHEIFDWIIYCILRKNKKKYLFCHDTFFDNRWLFDSDFYEWPMLKTKYRKFLEESHHQVCKEVLQFYQEKSKKSNDVPSPFYMKLKEKRGKVKSNSRFIKKYNKQATIPKENEKYFYLALHYQPECTTCPEAGSFVDQLLIVDLLSWYLPPDILLYVKEHPHQTVVGRTEDYYQKVCTHENVRLIRTDINTYELIDKSLCVCTCTGTVGVESIIRGKPVITFAKPYYEILPGVFPVKTNDELQVAINNILGRDYDIDSSEVKHALQFLYQESIAGVVNPFFLSRLNISPEKNKDNILKTIEEALV